MASRPPASERMTFARHVLEIQRKHARATGELSTVLLQVAFAGKIFAHALRRAALEGQLGVTGDINVQGEATRKLDVFGNRTIVDAFARNEIVAAIVSEEMDEPRQLAGGKRASYVLAVDPLDGSSNSDINGVVATIFGVYRPPREGRARVAAEHIRSGRDQVAAGYILYGPSTVLVYTAGHGVHGFTLDHDIGEFLLTHPDMQCPAEGSYYCANLANLPDWDEGTQTYIRQLAGGERAYSLRYSGALVADLHRSLLEGGIYLYPADRHHPQGKLRLAYECAPLAFVIEQAGGAAGTGTGAVLDVPLDSIHQRVPFAAGSREEVGRYEHFIRGRG